MSDFFENMFKITCPKCGTKFYFWKCIGSWTCENCGSKISSKGEKILNDEERKSGKCPYCGSKDLQPVAVGETKGFNTGVGCCGVICLGPLGWFCGMSEMGKGKTEAKRMCMKCGKHF